MDQIRGEGGQCQKQPKILSIFLNIEFLKKEKGGFGFFLLKFKGLKCGQDFDYTLVRYC